MTPLHSEAITGLFNGAVRPIFLLGAGASVRSGVPLAAQLLESISKFAFCKTTARAVDDPTLMRSDWMRWLEQQDWYRRDAPPADLYPIAVENLLQPKVFRKEFFQTILRKALDPSDGYVRLVSLMAKKSLSTVLTTNFDDLVARSVRSTRAVAHCEELRTPSDYAMFDTEPAVPQVIYLHGSVDHYSDKNLVDETQRLDQDLVVLLSPMLRDHPLVVVGYRGAEPSVMRHLLIDQAQTCMKYRRGIYWCFRRGSDALAESPMLRELQALIGSNLQLVEIDGFDELMSAVDRHVVPVTTATQSAASGAHSRNLPFDMQASGCGIDALSDLLIRAKLVAYADGMREETPTLDTEDRLLASMQAHNLAVSDGISTKVTNGAQLLFVKRAEMQIEGAQLHVEVAGQRNWVAAVLDVTEDVVAESESIAISGNLWEQLDQATALLSRVNRPFRMKGAVSHTAYPYPPLALKELLTNLIAHRSYVEGSVARVIVKPEEIVFDNPGGLVESVRRDLDDESLQEVIGVGSRRPKGYRNPVIAEFFYSAGAMDKAGSGLPDVVQEAANNLNQVTFGPTPENDRFSACIKCRPEALFVDAETRTARPSAGEQRYSANLLRVVDWPKSVWRVGTVEDSKKVNKLEALGVDPFGCARGWIWTFADRNSPTARSLFSLAVEEECSQVTVETMLTDRDAHSVVPQLLNQALVLRLSKLGLFARLEAGRIRAYYPSIDGGPREISYRSTFKQARRTVAKPVLSRSTGQVVYWEHKAVQLRFEQFGSSWALSMLPGYIFTVDGEARPIASERIGPLSTRRASRDYNPTVMHDLVFWSRMLSEEDTDTPFSLALSRASESPAAIVAAVIPSFVFQDSLDIGTSEGEEVDFSVEAEEADELQEQIEQAVAEANVEGVDGESSDS